MGTKERIERAIRIISAMPVTDDNQDLAVAAKNELRAALAELEQQEAKIKHEFDPTKKEEVQHE